MTPTLRLQLLKEFRISIEAQPLERSLSPRLQALLTYLALHPQSPQSRQQIAVRFWLDSTEQQARTNLRRLLHHLQQQFPQITDWLELGRQEIRWRADASMTSDVEEIRHALQQFPNDPKLVDATFIDSMLIETIIEHYRGELLPNCYDEWLLDERTILHEEVFHRLQAMLEPLMAQHAYDLGIRSANFLLRLDPLSESVYRDLMRFHLLNGEEAAARRAYQQCVERLAEELDVPPDAETTALFERIDEGEFQGNASAQPMASDTSMHASPSPDEVTHRKPSIPLFGRAAEWQRLLDAWQTTPQQGARICLVWGEAGMGKTRLTEELQQWAKLQHGAVAHTRVYAAEGTLPYAPLSGWLRSQPLEAAIGRLAPHWQTEVARLLPELLTTLPDLPPPQSMAEGWQQQRFHEALARAVMTAPTPCLLQLDDIQWCDEQTLRWLGYLLRFESTHPLLIVATVRTEAVMDDHPLHQLIHPLQRSRQLIQIDLDPLDTEASKQLIDHLAPSDRRQELDPIATQAEGNPLFIVEMVRAHLEALTPAPVALLSRAADRPAQRASSHTLPAMVQAVIAMRLDQLSPSAQRVAELAAIVGRHFDATLLLATTVITEEELIRGIDELWQRRIIVETESGYTFTHEKIREAAYDAIPPMQRRTLHRHIAQALGARHQLDESLVWSQLAYHYEQARMPQESLPYLEKLAQQAAALDALTEAADYYARAIALHQSTVQPLHPSQGAPNQPAPMMNQRYSDPRGAFDLHNQRAALLIQAGDTAQLGEDVAALLALARQLDDPVYAARAKLRQSSYLARCGQMDQAISAGEAALELYQSIPDQAGEVQALRHLGLICWVAQAYGKALVCGREVLQQHRLQNNIAGEATALHNLAEIYRSLDHAERAVTLYKQALELYWGQQDLRNQAITLYSLAFAYRKLGQPDDALAAYLRAQELCNQTDDQIISSRIQHALAIFYWEMDQPDAARAAIQQAVAQSEGSGYLPGVAYGQVAHSFIVAQLGHPEQATDLLQQARVALTRMDNQEGVKEVEARLAILAAGKIDLPEPSPALHWTRSYVEVAHWTIYCEFELPHAH